MASPQPSSGALPSVRSARRAAPQRQPLTETRLHSIIQQEMDLSALWWGGSQTEERRRLMRAYLGAPRGDEKPGRSRVTSRAAYETVEWTKPLLMQTFFSGPEVAAFQPQTGEEDEDQARQRTDAANYVFLRQNDGFRVTLDALTDSLVRRRGWVKVWYERLIERERQRYRGKTEEELFELLEDDGQGEWSIVTAAEADPVTLEMQLPTGETFEQEVPAWDCEVVRDRTRQRVRVEAVPPHEVWLNPDARSPYHDSCRFIQHRQTKFTESRAIAMGFDPDEVARIPSSSGVWGDDQDDLTMLMRGQAGIFQRNERQDAERQITISECYLRVDIDGDGITEWIKVFVGGDYGEQLLTGPDGELYEPVARHPFALFEVIPLPHSAEGLSQVDTVEDINDIETTVKRMWLDNLYFAVQGRWNVRVQGQPGEAVTPMVDMDQLANAIPGSWVFTWSADALTAIAAPIEMGPFQDAFARLVEDRQRRTGVSPEAFGIDPTQIANSVPGVMAQQNASQLRTMLMAMIVAEGLRRVFGLIDECLLRNPTQAMQLKLRGTWTKVNPADWRGQMDCEIGVGIGAGSRPERTANLTRMLELQKLGREAGLRWITDKNLYNTFRQLVINSGFRAAEDYVTDPDLVAAAPEPADPADVAVAYEHHIQQQRIELDKQKLAIEARKQELTHLREVKALELEHSTKLRELERAVLILEASLRSAPVAPPGPPPPRDEPAPQPGVQGQMIGSEAVRGAVGAPAP